jgi:hypothetical protein
MKHKVLCLTKVYIHKDIEADTEEEAADLVGNGHWPSHDEIVEALRDAGAVEHECYIDGQEMWATD